VRYTLFESRKAEVILIARILLVALFVIFGWSKLTDFGGTVAFMTAQGVPFPMASTTIAVVVEFFVGIAILIGFYTRPLALLCAIYTLATALVAHHYWTMVDGARAENMINFYKNISIVGGLLLLSVTGAGKYSVDRK
jgi:putative oxidoreductase